MHSKMLYASELADKITALENNDELLYDKPEDCSE